MSVIGREKSNFSTHFLVIISLIVLNACSHYSHSNYSNSGKPDMFSTEGYPDIAYKNKNTAAPVVEEGLGEPVVAQAVASRGVSDLYPGEYRLKSGDRIEISVWDEDMTKSLLVQPDGRISYPLAGRFYVSGKTLTEVATMIELRLAEYIYDPKVTVIGKSFEGNYVSIVGAVQKPGQVVVGEEYRVLDVFTAAGGVRYSESTINDAGGEMANLSKAYLSRKGKIMPVDFGALIYDGDMRYNIRVEIGDFIYVPSSSSEGIYVTGEVASPMVIPHRGRPNILQVITEAGGGNKKGHLDSVVVVRGSLGNPQTTIVNVEDIMKGKQSNFYLNAGDIVYVPETFLSKVERISEQITPFLDLITQGDAAVNVIKDF